MKTNPMTIASPTTISSEFFKTVNASVSSYIRKKLRSINIEADDLELHNSSLTKTCRAYITISRPANIKALGIAEKILCEEIERQFAFRPSAFYWRYRPDSVEA
jgi:hypothetical protein